jgi:hypothetical protein
VCHVAEHGLKNWWMICTVGKGKGKGKDKGKDKVRPKTGHEDPEGE